MKILPSQVERMNVVFVGNFLPRRCGIATFTHDLYHAVAKEIGEESLRVVAMNNIPEGYDYPEAVTFEIQQNRVSDYQRAAEYINLSDVDLVCIQHEFGIFGEKAGAYLTTLLANIKKPTITTLHSVLKEPPPEYRQSMMNVIRYSHRLVVMSEQAISILHDVYGVEKEKVTLIHHGTPDAPFVDPNFYKDKFNVDGKPVILTFGLLSPNKGIETALDALPAVVKRFPELAYIVLGATHPEVNRHAGESYRLLLERKVRDLGLEKNVIFHNRFVELNELLEFIAASDIYLTPYLNREQIVSGTLAYAVAMGKAVISTPYWYAEELLSDDRGVLIDFGDSKGLADALIRLLEDHSLRNQIRKNAYIFGRQMTWKEVGRRYVEEFQNLLRSRDEIPSLRWARQAMSPEATLPELNLRHLRVLSDDVGLFQHALFSIPDREHGYSADDVGRGLVVLTQAYDQAWQQVLESLIAVYMSFIKHAQLEDGHFHNFMGYDRCFLDERGSDDTLGRVVWGLGSVVRNGPTKRMQALAMSMIDKAVPRIEELFYPRSKAYSICGLADALSRYKGARRFRQMVEKLASDLADQYESGRSDGWEWFEEVVTYGNAKLPEALLLAYQLTGQERFRTYGLESLEFLTRSQWNGKYFDLVGNNGWWRKGKEKALFGQQPIDAGYLTTAYVTAYQLTHEKRYLTLAQQAFEWFLGRNRLAAALYDFQTGAVADGLDAHGVSENQGAESVICFLLALLSLSHIRAQRFEKNPVGMIETENHSSKREDKKGITYVEQAHCDDFQLSASAVWHRDLL